MNIFDHQVIRLDEVDSTNNYTANLLKSAIVAEGTVILALNQTSGRGQIQNVWQSEPYQNLTFSVVLRPTFLSVQGQFALSQVVSIAVCDAISEMTGQLTAIKWPNDILVNHKKVGGILVESAVMGSKIANSIVGIGLNINQEKFPGLPNASSLSIESARKFDLDKVLTTILEQLDFRYRQLQLGKLTDLKKYYLDRLIGVGKYLHYTDVRGNSMQLSIVDVTSEGRLIAQNSDGILSQFNFKEIELAYHSIA